MVVVKQSIIRVVIKQYSKPLVRIVKITHYSKPLVKLFHFSQQHVSIEYSKEYCFFLITQGFGGRSESLALACGDLKTLPLTGYDIVIY